MRFAQLVFRLPDVNPGALFFTDCLQRSLAGNAPFPPLAEMLAVQPCQGVAEGVSLVPFACSVLEGADYHMPALQDNGTRPRKHRPSITSCDDVFAPIGVKIREATGLEASEPFFPEATWMTSRAPFPGKHSNSRVLVTANSFEERCT